MTPEVRRAKSLDPMRPTHVEIVCGRTVYALKLEEVNIPRGWTMDQVIDSETRSLGIFHERRYVKQPYKTPLRRPAR